MNDEYIYIGKDDSISYSNKYLYDKSIKIILSPTPVDGLWIATKPTKKLLNKIYNIEMRYQLYIYSRNSGKEETMPIGKALDIKLTTQSPAEVIYVLSEIEKTDALASMFSYLSYVEISGEQMEETVLQLDELTVACEGKYGFTFRHERPERQIGIFKYVGIEKVPPSEYVHVGDVGGLLKLFTFVDDFPLSELYMIRNNRWYITESERLLYTSSTSNTIVAIPLSEIPGYIYFTSVKNYKSLHNILEMSVHREVVYENGTTIDIGPEYDESFESFTTEGTLSLYDFLFNRDIFHLAHVFNPFIRANNGVPRTSYTIVTSAGTVAIINPETISVNMADVFKELQSNDEE